MIPSEECLNEDLSTLRGEVFLTAEGLLKKEGLAADESSEESEEESVEEAASLKMGRKWARKLDPLYLL